MKKRGISPLDTAIKSNQIKSIVLLLDMIVKFQENHCFNFLIDKHFNTLIDKQINLNDYFDSSLPIIKINSKNFPELHHDDSELIIGVSFIDNP